jgi:hypothetical protein
VSPSTASPNGELAMAIKRPEERPNNAPMISDLLGNYDQVMSSEEEDLSIIAGGSDAEEENMYSFRRTKNSQYQKVSRTIFSRCVCWVIRPIFIVLAINKRVRKLAMDIKRGKWGG